MAKVETSNPDRTISLKRLQCVVENKNNMNLNLSEAQQLLNNLPMNIGFKSTRNYQV